MMKRLLFIICLLWHCGVNGQTWAPYGATWTYTYVNAGTYPPHPVPDYPSTWVADTTTFHGRLCNVMYEGTVPTGSFDTGRMFDYVITYEDGDQVYWYSPASDSFTLLFDFSKKKGESWEMNGIRVHGDATGSPCIGEVHVLSTGIETINGIPLKSMEIEGDGYVGSNTVIQHIGSTLQPRPTPNFMCMYLFDYTEYNGLRCIDIPGIGFHDFKIAPSCDYVTGITDPETATLVSCTPNPSDGQMTISYKGNNTGSIAIRDLSGRLMISLSLSPQQQIYPINISSWPAGMYIYSLQQEGKAVITGKLIRN